MQGSLVNRMYESMTIGAPEPFVGMDATITSYTDRQAATVYNYYPDTRMVVVREDEVTRPFEAKPYSQDWICKPNPSAPPKYFRMSKSGRWDRVTVNPATGRWKKVECTGLILGVKDHYYDFQF